MMAPARRNLLWMMFTDADNRARMPRWEPAARNVLSQFRAAFGARPDDPRFIEIVHGITAASREFRGWWAEYPVREFQPVTISVEHPVTGPIALDLVQTRLVDHPDLLLVMQLPATADDLHRVTRLLTRSATGS